MNVLLPNQPVRFFVEPEQDEKILWLGRPNAEAYLRAERSKIDVFFIVALIGAAIGLDLCKQKDASVWILLLVILLIGYVMFRNFAHDLAPVWAVGYAITDRRIIKGYANYEHQTIIVSESRIEEIARVVVKMKSDDIGTLIFEPAYKPSKKSYSNSLTIRCPLSPYIATIIDHWLFASTLQVDMDIGRRGKSGL